MPEGAKICVYVYVYVYASMSMSMSKLSKAYDCCLKVAPHQHALQFLLEYSAVHTALLRCICAAVHNTSCAAVLLDALLGCICAASLQALHLQTET